MVANGCTTGWSQPAYGFTFSRSLPSAWSADHDCGPTYRSNANAPFLSGTVVLAYAASTTFPVRGAPRRRMSRKTPAGGVEPTGCISATSQYFVRAATHWNEPVSTRADPGSSFEKATLFASRRGIL